MQALIESSVCGELAMFVIAYKKAERVWESEGMMEEVECYLGDI